MSITKEQNSSFIPPPKDNPCLHFALYISRHFPPCILGYPPKACLGNGAFEPSKKGCDLFVCVSNIF